MKPFVTALMIILPWGCTSAGGNVDMGAIDGHAQPMDAAAPDALIGGKFSCDVTMAGIHECIDYAWTGTSDFSPSLKGDCQTVGTVVGPCSHSDTNGGCMLESKTADLTDISITWYYGAPTAQMIMQVCNAIKATFVAP